MYYYSYVTYPFTLNSIYILTREASSLNSLFIDFTAQVASSIPYYLEFIFEAFDLSYFNINNGDEILCNLNTGFTAISGKTKAARCYGYASGIG